MKLSQTDFICQSQIVWNKVIKDTFQTITCVAKVFVYIFDRKCIHMKLPLFVKWNTYPALTLEIVEKDETRQNHPDSMTKNMIKRNNPDYFKTLTCRISSAELYRKTLVVFIFVSAQENIKYCAEGNFFLSVRKF